MVSGIVLDEPTETGECGYFPSEDESRSRVYRPGSVHSRHRAMRAAEARLTERRQSCWWRMVFRLQTTLHRALIGWEKQSGIYEACKWYGHYE